MRKNISITLAALACSVSGAAVAQNAGVDTQPPAADAKPAPAVADASAGLEDIVVTATRREERLQDVPVAVTAITNSALGGAGVSILRELTSSCPASRAGGTPA